MSPLFAQIDLAHAVSGTDSGIDVNQLAHLSQGNPVMLLALAGVAILGGKKIWDIWQQRQEQQHEQKMAEIEASKGSSSAGHEQCVAKQQALESQVAVLKDKIANLDSKAESISKAAEDANKQHQDALVDLEQVVKKNKKKVKKLEELVQDKQEKKKEK